MLTGPPGVGKTMLAQRLPGLLPSLSDSESLEVTAIHSVAGLLSDATPLITRPPFVAPHHSSSVAALVGGGSGMARPGAISRAHRGVLFLDTAGFSLYNNAFILRRRIRYEDGFPAGEPEIVCKFRHPEMQRAAEMDVRPQIAGEYVVKFKAEALPLKDEVGGYRLLFSHNVEFGLSQAPEGDRTSMHTLTRIFPCMSSVLKTDADRVELVNQTIVEDHLLGVRFAMNVFIASIIVWITLRFFTHASPIWAIASMIASSEPVVKQGSRCSGTV